MARKYGSKRNLAQRKSDNKGVKDGTIRKGKGGKTVRKYDAKTGRWKVLRVIDKEGRTEKTRTTTSSGSGDRDTKSEKPAKDTPAKDTSKETAYTYTPGAGTVVKTPGDRGMDAARRWLEERGGSATKTRGRDARVRANNARIQVKKRKEREDYRKALQTAAQRLQENRNKYRR